MASLKIKQEEDHLKALREMMAIGCNKSCFDCGQRGPTYVNMTIGSFVCTSCSGRLRGLNPPHRVKSISMATFTSEEIDLIKSQGNDFCRKVWMGKADSPIRSQSNSDMDESSLAEDLIQKYEKKRWYVAPTEDLYEEAKRLNALSSIKRTDATLLSHASQMTTSRSVSNISTQSIQRPIPGNVRSIPGAAPHIHSMSSLPQSPVKHSPQTPKASAVSSVWGTHESPRFSQPPGVANFADFASFESSAQQQIFFPSTFSAGCAVTSPPFAAFASPNSDPFQSPYKPPVPPERYAALAELDSTRTTFPESFAWDANGGARGQAVETNPFGSPPVPMATAHSGAPVHSQFFPASVGSVPTYSMGIHPATYYGTPPQQMGIPNNSTWSGTPGMFQNGGQAFPAPVAANPFLNISKQNATNPFL